jgi:hypothetical protein
LSELTVKFTPFEHNSWIGQLVSVVSSNRPGEERETIGLI